MANRRSMIVAELLGSPVPQEVASLALALHDVGFWTGEEVPQTEEEIVKEFGKQALASRRSSKHMQNLAASWLQRLKGNDIDAVETLAQLGIKYVADRGTNGNTRSSTPQGTSLSNDPNAYRVPSFNG